MNPVGKLGILGVGLVPHIWVKSQELVLLGPQVDRFGVRGKVSTEQANLHTSERSEFNNQLIGDGLAVPPLQGLDRYKLVFAGSHINQADLLTHSGLRVKHILPIVAGIGVDVVND